MVLFTSVTLSVSLNYPSLDGFFSEESHLHVLLWALGLTIPSALKTRQSSFSSSGSTVLSFIPNHGTKKKRQKKKKEKKEGRKEGRKGRKEGRKEGRRERKREKEGRKKQKKMGGAESPKTMSSQPFIVKVNTLAGEKHM